MDWFFPPPTGWVVCILFPELEKLVPTLHMASVYAMLSEFPGAKQVANAHLTRFTNLLSEASKGRYGKETAIAFRNTARTSIGSNMPAKQNQSGLIPVGMVALIGQNIQLCLYLFFKTSFFAYGAS